MEAGTGVVTMPVALVWCLCLFIPLSTTALEPNITVPPLAVNISLNQVAEFNCTAVANGFFWHRNGVQLDNGVNISTRALNSDKNIRMSTLRIKVTSADDAGNITCYALSDEQQGSQDSSTVLLLVQGLLKPVHNLSVAFINSTTVLVSWCPPFTLEGVPILGYDITITDTTSGENETISVEGDATMLYYSTDPVDNFTVTVICFNKAGPGENSSMKFLMSLIPVTYTSTLQVISSSTSTVMSTPSVTPSTLTASHSVSPAPFRADNKPGIIIGVMSIIVVAVVVAVSCISVVVYCKRRQKKQQHTDDNKKYSELDTTDYENQNETEDAASDVPLLRSKSYPQESEHTSSVFNSLPIQLPEMTSEMQDVLNEAMQI